MSNKQHENVPACRRILEALNQILPSFPQKRHAFCSQTFGQPGNRIQSEKRENGAGVEECSDICNRGTSYTAKQQVRRTSKIIRQQQTTDEAVDQGSSISTNPAQLRLQSIHKVCVPRPLGPRRGLLQVQVPAARRPLCCPLPALPPQPDALTQT